MSVLFQPSRAFRRTVMGKPCQACGLLLHHRDVVAVRTDDALLYLHEACALSVLEHIAGEDDES